MIPEWCALCLVGSGMQAARGKGLLALSDSEDRREQWADAVADVQEIREAAGTRVLWNGSNRVGLALTTYGGTPVCAWHLDEEIGRRRLCR